jgi:4'-phosphopantetheinyl transferase
MTGRRVANPPQDAILPHIRKSFDLPAPAEVHVWLHSLSSSGGELALLAPDERRRAGRFRFERDRDAFIASHAWLRTLLGRYLRADPRGIEFAFGKHGKPFIHDAPIHFNLSHSGAMAACAIARDHEVGIDIELIRPMPGIDFRCWTRREAYVKATGGGLSAPAEAASDDWFVIDLDAGPGYAGAVAIRGSNWNVLLRRS